jgi:hypothetical protein
MARQTSRIVALFALALLAACGSAPTPAEQATWPVRLESFPFSGLADPASGRFRLRAGPQAALTNILEDANGTPGVAAPNTLEIFGATVSFAAGNVGYPAGCNPAAPMVMRSDVKVTSGFASQQLRNVYARITSISAGPTFCTVASAGNFTAELGSYSGLYLYAPLDFGTQVAGGNLIASANTRTQTWALNLPSNAPYSFSGDIKAEVIPQPPALSTSPGYAAATNSINGPGNVSTLDVAFTGTPDPLASGNDPEGFRVNRPSTSSASILVQLCNLNTLPFDASVCTTQATQAAPGPLKYKFKFRGSNNDETFWWRTVVQHLYRLPGETVDRTISTSLVFKVVP